MKKYIFIAIAIIAAAIVAALYMTPGAAKTPAADASVPKAMGEVLVKQVSAPAATSTSTAATTTIKKITPVKETVTVKPTAPAAAVKKTSTVKIASTGIRWASSGLSAIGSLSSFDYSTSIRNAYKRKVEAYAKSKGITLITASVVNSMHQ
jgi:hypothetical protein